MNPRLHVWTVAAVLCALLGAQAWAATTLRDFSGDAMQRYDSRMMSSPVMRFPGLFGIAIWPYIAYPPAPSLTIVNVHVTLPAQDPHPAPPPSPPARPKFWTSRCGIFVELDVNSTMNLMEEERKPCAP
jgi:hypothetical protein